MFLVSSEPHFPINGYINDDSFNKFFFLNQTKSVTFSSKLVLQLIYCSLASVTSSIKWVQEQFLLIGSCDDPLKEAYKVLKGVSEMQIFLSKC